MYEWAREIISSAGTGHLIDTAAALKLLDAHRDGPIDYSRKIWTLLVFMIWHGIFVEGRIRPEIPQPVYPVAI
jgi:asparagine synthase (glutamine-hydrolysing)